MKRSPLRRQTPLKRGGRLRFRNTKRHNVEWLRAYGSAERVAWVQRQPCCVTGNRRGIENVHVRTGGMGRKADACWIVPLSRDLHRLLHAHGKSTFEAAYGVDLDTIARLTEASWRRHIYGQLPETTT